jgi:hypothetical protein
VESYTLIFDLGEKMIYNMSKSEMYNERTSLYGQKMKLDRFFTLYLDKFGSKMDADNPDTKIWKLYKSKLKEYEQLTQKIKHIEYWIAK